MSAGAETFLLMKLVGFVEREGARLAGLEKTVQHLTDEVGFWRILLQTKHTDDNTDVAVGRLVKQMREVVYDVDDAVEDYDKHIALDQKHGIYTLTEKALHFIRTLYPRHRISKKLQDCKSRVDNALGTFRRLYPNIDLSATEQSSQRTSATTRLGDTLLIGEVNLVGIDGPKGQLIQWLIKDNANTLVISVVGMAGVGKTTLVKRAFEDAGVKAHFVFRAGIILAQSFKMEDLLKDMIRQLYQGLHMVEPLGIESMDNARLRAAICEFLREKRYLIVLDDICNIHHWRDFRRIFPDNGLGSRILLTTRETDIASECSSKPSDELLSVDRLSLKDSWSLFCNTTFPSGSFPHHLEDVSKRILKKCEGLPLAIVTIGGVLLTMDRSRLDEWEMIYRGLGSVMAEHNTDFFLLSYNNLPYYLQSCLMYFSIFPEGHPIERMKLVRLWVAEGFVKQMEGMTPEDVATKYLKELINRNLVQIVEATSDGQVKTCRIHQLLRETMTRKAKNEGFVAIIEKDSSFPRKVRRLSIHDATSSLQKRRVPSQLRSVHTFWTVGLLPQWNMFRLSSPRLRHLNALDLSAAPLPVFPDGILSLHSLKYLSLRSTKVRCIPSSIDKLKNLETLDLKYAPVINLPAEISLLPNLRHLLVYHYFQSEKCGFKAPVQIGKLKSLQKLCFLEANSELLEGLRSLNQLRRLGILKLQERDGKVLCLVIMAQVDLLALSVTSTSEKEFIDLNYLNPDSCPKLLRRLYLTGPLKELPGWISLLDNLAKVVLKGSLLHCDPLPCLEKLPNLVHLEFNQVSRGRLMIFRSETFQKLKFLGLNNFDNLTDIRLLRGSVPHLQELIIESCPYLHEVPSGIEYLKELRALKFFDMPSHFINRLRPDVGQDYHLLQHVREVVGTYWKNDERRVYSKESSDTGATSTGPSTSRRTSGYDWKI